MKVQSNTYFSMLLIVVSQVLLINANPSIRSQTANDLGHFVNDAHEAQKLQRRYEGKQGFHSNKYTLEHIKKEFEELTLTRGSRLDLHRIMRSTSTELVNCDNKDVVVNVRGFLNSIIFQLEHLLAMDENVITRMKNQLEQHTVEKTEQIKSVIKSEITPEINSINVKMAENIDQTIRRISDMKKAAEGDLQEQILQETGYLKNLTYLKRLFTLASALTAAINSGFAQSHRPFTTTDIEMGVELPQVLQTGTDYVTSRVHVLDNLLYDLTENQPALLDLKNIIDEQRRRLMGNINTDALPIIARYLIEMKKNMTNIHGWRTCNSPGDNEFCAINNFEKMLKVASLSVEVYDKYVNNSEALQILYDAANLSTESEMAEISAQECKIYALCIPSVLYLQRWIEIMLNYDQSILPQSIMDVDETKWIVHETLKSINAKVQELTNGLPTSEKTDFFLLRANIRKLAEAIDTVFNIFYENAVHLEYRRVIDLRRATNVQGDKDYVPLICLYKTAFNAYKQLAFPIIEMVEGFGKVNLNTQTNPNDNIPQLAARAMWEIFAMKIKLDTFNTTISGSYKGNIKKEYFKETSKHGTLFRWASNRNDRLLADLFEGKEITVNANITAGVNENAVKFKKLHIRIKEHDPNVQKLITNAMNNFQIALTHSGESYYRCDEHVYKITTSEIPMRFSFAKTRSHMPEIYNMVYSKVNTGDLLLSPYTTWTIKLKPFSKDYDFSEMQQFTELEMELQLEGEAYFLKGSDMCDENLKNFYELVQ